MPRLNRSPDWRRWLILVALILGLDQLTKLMVTSSLTLGTEIMVTSYFNLVFVLNPGAAFSFLADAGGWQRWFFTALTVVIVSVLLFLVRKSPHQALFCLAASLIMGGALGNLIDRLMIGAVIDFLDFHMAGWHWPAFNLADAAITAGAALFILDELLRVRRGSRA
ncbi:MAG: Lipoprotein signal peptidase [Pseudomonadota bacterium]